MKGQLVVFEDGHIILALVDSPGLSEEVRTRVQEAVKRWRETAGSEHPMLLFENVSIEFIKGDPIVKII